MAEQFVDKDALLICRACKWIGEAFLCQRRTDLSLFRRTNLSPFLDARCPSFSDFDWFLSSRSTLTAGLACRHGLRSGPFLRRQRRRAVSVLVAQHNRYGPG